jgi:hypothetical protein
MLPSQHLDARCGGNTPNGWRVPTGGRKRARGAASSIVIVHFCKVYVRDPCLDVYTIARLAFIALWRCAKQRLRYICVFEHELYAARRLARGKILCIVISPHPEDW